MATNIEITDLKKSEQEFRPDQIGKLVTLPPDEVGGRGPLVYYSRCSVCGFIGSRSDAQKYPAHQCSNCGAVLTAGG